MIRFSETVRVHPHSSGQLLIGVPTLHRYQHLRRCLTGILASAPSTAEIVVIDNGGTFQNDISPRIQIVRPQCNLGAPGSWNLIGDLADGREFMIFNDDIVAAPNTIAEMLRAPGWMVCSYSFGAFLVRPLLWKTVGRFDEFLWPMYWEDTDYQARMRLAIIEDCPGDGSIPPSPLDDNAPMPGDPRRTNGLTRIKGGIIQVTRDGMNHLDGGSQTRRDWMIPWINRTEDRFMRKWNAGQDRSAASLSLSRGEIFLSRQPFNGTPDDPLAVYWNECHQNGWEPYMDVMLEYAAKCETVLQLGLHVGRFTLPFLRSAAVKQIHCFDWNRPEEWDFIMRLDELHGRKIALHSTYDPRRIVPDADLLFIDEANSNPIAKRWILKQIDRVKKYIAFLGPDSATCPACDEFKRQAAGWTMAHHNNGLTIFARV